MAEKKVSMKDVSARSGVSIATVSRVIHGNGRFSEETAKRVLAVMQELEYTPDTLAQGMRKKTMPVIGMIVPDILDDRYGNLVRTTQERLFHLGYTTVVFNSNENNVSSQGFIDSLSGQHAGGLVLIPGSRGNDLDLRDIPTVFLERRPTFTPNCPHVQITFNDRECACEAMERLLSLGCRHILLLGDRMGISSFQERMAGAEEALLAAGIQEEKTLRMDPQRSSETVAALSAISLAEYDAIFCLSIRMTIGALKVLNDQEIPRDRIRVIGIGEHRLLKYGLLQYDAVIEPIQEMAGMAADRIIDLIRGNPVETEYKLNCTLLPWD